MLSKQEIAGLRELLAKATPVVSHTRIPVPRQTLAALLDIAEAVANAPVVDTDPDDFYVSTYAPKGCKRVAVLPLAGEVANG